jgi:parvulin-like peptidyl-prolyl isomerase
MKAQLEAAVAQEMAKMPPNADNLAKQQKRAEVLEKEFGSLAKQKSSCPSKDQGGDVGWFPRAGSMVEPFAKVAFAMKPYELSDVVTTQFGSHLILCVDHKAGKETKFEEAKEMVKEVYGARMREALLAQLRPAAKIQK